MIALRLRSWCLISEGFAGVPKMEYLEVAMIRGIKIN